jgi:hypothetical protein
VNTAALVLSIAAIAISSVALYFTYKQHTRDVERRSEEKERLADERRERDSASLTWQVVRTGYAGNGTQIFVTNHGADAEDMTISVERPEQPPPMGLFVGLVRRGQTAACGNVWSIPPQLMRIKWNRVAQWTDASGLRKERWHLTNITEGKAP